MKKRLYKSAYDKQLAGVLGGIAEYLDIDPTLIRLVYVFLTLFTAGFPGVLFYIIAAVVIPESPQQ